MSINHISAFDKCYLMQPEDIERFADTLADGFRQYALFQYICGGVYDHDKMKRFWAVSIALAPANAVCIADSEEINSVLIYIPPKSPEPGILSYLKVGGVKMYLKMGMQWLYRLLRFDSAVQKMASRHKTDDDGYLMAFATRKERHELEEMRKQRAEMERQIEELKTMVETRQRQVSNDAPTASIQ